MIDDAAARGRCAAAPALRLLVTLTNPKAIVLFASVFATAVTASTPHCDDPHDRACGREFARLVLDRVLVHVLTPVMSRFQLRHWIERVAGCLSSDRRPHHRRRARPVAP
jgi:threonine/homoserine/homoserine lactone efflux protein